MTRNSILQPCSWGFYSKKLVHRIENPKNVGFFTEEDARSRMMRLVVGKAEDLKERNKICFYWLVDESDGVIADVKFQIFGGPALLGAVDVTCELLLRKNYDQARRIHADLIDKQLRDKSEQKAFPEEFFPQLHLVISAIDHAAQSCFDIPFADTYAAPPMPGNNKFGDISEYPGWKELSLKQKIAVIEEVIESEVRPYIELDAGGVQVLNLLNDREVIIAYQGSCTSCYSATGATLNAIQQILQNKIHSDLIVTPDLSFLNY